MGRNKFFKIFLFFPKKKLFCLKNNKTLHSIKLNSWCFDIIQLYTRTHKKKENGRPINSVRYRFINYYDVYLLRNTVDPKIEQILYWPRPPRISYHRKTTRRNRRIELENYLRITTGKKANFLAKHTSTLFSLRIFFFQYEINLHGDFCPAPRVLESAYTVLNPCMMLNSYMRSNS